MVDFLITNGTAIVIADATDYNPTAGVSLLGTRTHQIDLTGLVSGQYRQSAKVDFGSTRARWWYSRLAFEPTSAPTAAGAVEVYIGFSRSGIAGSDNPANLSGTDTAYNGYGAAAADATEALTHLQRILFAIPTADADVQVLDGWTFQPTLQFGSLVVRNNINVNFAADAVEMSIQLIPILDQSA